MLLNRIQTVNPLNYLKSKSQKTKIKKMNRFDNGDHHDKFSDFYTYSRTLGQGAFGTVV